MITGFFLQIFYAIISFFIGLLPTITFPTGFTNALNLFWGFINQFSFLFPLSTLLTVLGIVFAYYIAILVLDLALWIIHLIRGR